MPVNFGASTTTEVSSGLVEQSVVIHYSLAFSADHVLGATEMCNLSTVPGDGGTLGTWISRAVNSPPREQHTAQIGFSPANEGMSPQNGRSMANSLHSPTWWNCTVEPRLLKIPRLGLNGKHWRTARKRRKRQKWKI